MHRPRVGYVLRDCYPYFYSFDAIFILIYQNQCNESSKVFQKLCLCALQQLSAVVQRIDLVLEYQNRIVISILFYSILFYSILFLELFLIFHTLAIVQSAGDRLFFAIRPCCVFAWIIHSPLGGQRTSEEGGQRASSLQIGKKKHNISFIFEYYSLMMMLYSESRSFLHLHTDNYFKVGREQFLSSTCLYVYFYNKKLVRGGGVLQTELQLLEVAVMLNNSQHMDSNS